MARLSYEEAARAHSRGGLDPRVMAPLVSGRNPDGTCFTLPTTSAITEAVGAQSFFFAGSGKLALRAAGNLRATISNPDGSGKTLYLVRLVAFGTATGWASLLINPTTGLPGTAARPVNNAVIGAGGSPVGVVKADTNLTVALGDGTDTGIAIGLEGGSRAVVDLPPFVLAPGVSLGINVPFAGAADASLTAYWFEE